MAAPGYGVRSGWQCVALARMLTDKDVTSNAYEPIWPRGLSLLPVLPSTQLVSTTAGGPVSLCTQRPFGECASTHSLGWLIKGLQIVASGSRSALGQGELAAEDVLTAPVPERFHRTRAFPPWSLSELVSQHDGHGCPTSHTTSTVSAILAPRHVDPQVAFKSSSVHGRYFLSLPGIPV